MKRTHSFAAIAAAALGLAGCWSQPSLKTDTITESGNYALYEGSKDSLATEITLEIPTGGLKTEQLEKNARKPHSCSARGKIQVI